MSRTKRASILLVEDEKTTAAFYSALIRSQGYQAFTCHNGNQALSLLQAGQEFDLVLLDLGLPDISGWEILTFIKQDPKLRYIPVLVVTASGDKVSFLKALQQGAEDFLIKPVDVDTLQGRMAVMLRIRGLYKDLESPQSPQSENKLLRRYLAKHMGPSLVVSQLGQRVERLLEHETTVLLEGAPGSGKSFMAEVLHRFSRHAGGPLVRLRCGRGSESKFLARLLGVENPRQEGALEKAQGGTLYLQDIEELSPLSQLTILKIIQDQQFRRLGGEQELTARLQILVSTGADLKSLVENNRFREDLYYRLGVVGIQMPDLRSRLEDIPYLAQQYLNRKFGKTKKSPPVLSAAATGALQAHNWPENVRSLFAVLDGAAQAARGGVVEAEHLPLKNELKPRPSAPLNTLAEQERRLIMESLERNGGNKSRAAAALGISRSTLYNKMSIWDIK